MRAHFQLPRANWLSLCLFLSSLVLIVGILYWARDVLIPLALAVLLSFILAPVVTLLRRRGLGRTLSVVLTVVFTFALLGAIGAMITIEFRSLANDLPKYRQNIRKKISDVRLAGKGGSIEKVQETVKDVINEIKKEDPAAPKLATAVPVVVTGNKATETSMPVLGPLLEPLASGGLVVVLVIFMLLRREDLRDRLLRLAGYGRLAATTKAIDEAGKRVTKYLLRQSLLNASFGVGIGLGLYLIGLPYAILWGFLAAVARFIPYVGPWLGASAPILLGLAVFDGWTAPLLIIGLVSVLELITNLMVEPVLYGQTVGVSEVALLIMIAFWTWLWGPIGLVLSTPLTVCLMVIGKSVPDLEFIGVLLSSEPALNPHHGFYQRLVAKDGDEAHDTVETYLKDHSRGELFERLLLPTLVSCRHDHERGRLTDEDHAFVLRSIRQILEEEQTAAAALPPEARHPLEPRPLDVPAPEKRPVILGWPANDEADELALMMLAELLRADHWTLRILSSQLLSSESIAEVERLQPALVCVGFLPRGPVFTLRQFCKRLRASFPKVHVVVGQWGAPDYERTDVQLAGLVEAIGWNLSETKNQIIQFAQIETAPAANSETTPQEGRRPKASQSLVLS